MARIAQPCQTPCSSPGDHTLIFDEAFYVNAARTIAGIHPPAGAPYAGAPLGKDPNAEHPQLAKLIIAGGIELLGDGPWGWRLGSVLFGLLAICALYALVRGAGGSQGLAVGAAGVMALDNLMLVHSRIATLDIYAVALMLVAGALYVRRHPLLAGAVIGVGACTKIVALYLLVALAVFEAVLLLQARGENRGRADREEVLNGLSWHARLRPLASCTAVGVVVFLGLLWGMDVLVPGWDPGTRRVYAGNPLSHLGHMINVAQALKASHAQGIASSPWQWLIDQKPIDYARVAVNKVVKGATVASNATIDFRGEINPFIIFVALPALVAAGISALRSRERVALIAASWSLGTYVPFVIQSEIAHRISYLFYMLVVMPGVYVMTARLFSSRYVPRFATVAWIALLVFGFVRLYPLRTLVGG